MRLVAAILLASVASAHADTMTLSGAITAPTRVNAYGVYGYDNGGFFGPVGASLGGDIWTLTWTGTNCDCYSGVTDAVLTINGISLDLGANGIDSSEWLDGDGFHGDTFHGGFDQFIQLQTGPPTLPFPPGGTGPGGYYTAATNIIGGDVTSGGIQLMDSFHPYPTNFFITSYVGTPGPMVGAGWPGLMLAGGVLAWWRRKQK